jgi:hypothetical protein
MLSLSTKTNYGLRVYESCRSTEGAATLADTFDPNLQRVLVLAWSGTARGMEAFGFWPHGGSEQGGRRRSRFGTPKERFRIQGECGQETTL